ncbi:GlsB/YeaQ/YmgE family stress response membrane protein [Sphingomicrobium flavum]|uniref:GlsB/YeaQ/YmgE family stress response membrane protein n=1 Tax=Sphingomicrobium flavum TaxID=1229164 RepID=UPI0021AD5A0A|nr:GlsB/YeaQ/YmgE family stress response membrane protein [Sphingomicrobium flavum]
MGFIVYLIVGGLLGWLASIVMRTDAQQGIILNVIVGIVGAFLAGLVVSGGSIGDGITLQSVLISLVGAIVLLGIVNLIRRGKVR